MLQICLIQHKQWHILTLWNSEPLKFTDWAGVWVVWESLHSEHLYLSKISFIYNYGRLLNVSAVNQSFNQRRGFRGWEWTGLISSSGTLKWFCHLEQFSTLFFLIVTPVKDCASYETHMCDNQLDWVYEDHQRVLILIDLFLRGNPFFSQMKIILRLKLDKIWSDVSNQPNTKSVMFMKH